MDLGGTYYNTNTQVEALETLIRTLSISESPETPESARKPSAPPRKSKRLKPDDVNKLITAYRAGQTMRELADRFGIDRRTVSAILRRNGLQTRYRALTPDQVDEAVRYYNAGWSLARIGERYGVDPTIVLNRLRDQGIPTRDPQGHPRT